MTAMNGMTRIPAPDEDEDEWHDMTGMSGMTRMTGMTKITG